LLLLLLMLLLSSIALILASCRRRGLYGCLVAVVVVSLFVVRFLFWALSL